MPMPIRISLRPPPKVGGKLVTPNNCPPEVEVTKVILLSHTLVDYRFHHLDLEIHSVV